MSKKMFTRGVVVGAAVLALSGCLHFKGPLAVGDEVGTSKMGKSCVKHRFLSAKGDASIDAAKRNGRITRVSSVDWSFDTTMFWFSEGCVIVRGE